MGRSSQCPRAVHFGLFTADLESHELRKSGHCIKIQELPYEVLEALLERPGKVVTHEELRQRLWPEDTFVDFDHSLRTSILKLREALGDSAIHAEYVETVARRGYRFIAPVEFETKNADRELENSLLNITTARAVTRRYRAAAVAIGALITVLLVAFGLNLGRLRDRLLGWSNTEPITSVAVLPFKNLNGDEEAGYLCEGITASLINQLARFPGLRVMGRGTVVRYRQSRISPREAGQQMEVAEVVTGWILRHNDHFVVGVELLDVESGTQLWGGQFDRKAADPLTLQKDITGTILQKLRARLTNHDES